MISRGPYDQVHIGEEWYRVGFLNLDSCVQKNDHQFVKNFDMEDAILLKLLGKSRRVTASSIIEWHFCRAVKTLSRRITLRQRFKYPWTAIFKETVNKDAFSEVLRDYLREVLPPVGLNIDKTLYKNGNVKEIWFTFNKIGILVWFLKRAVHDRVDVVRLFSKQYKCGTSALVTCTEDKPAVFTYHFGRQQFTLKICYTVTNPYGFLLSF